MSIFTGFLRQCETAPNQPALIEDTNRLSYFQLKQQAAQISGFLVNQSRPCRRVAIALDRGIEATTAILGVLFSGACYIPLDIKNPANRLRFITDDADVQYVIGKGDCPDWMNDSQKWLDIVRIPELGAH